MKEGRRRRRRREIMVIVKRHTKLMFVLK